MDSCFHRVPCISIELGSALPTEQYPRCKTLFCSYMSHVGKSKQNLPCLNANVSRHFNATFLIFPFVGKVQHRNARSLRSTYSFNSTFNTTRTTNCDKLFLPRRKLSATKQTWIGRLMYIITSLT